MNKVFGFVLFVVSFFFIGGALGSCLMRTSVGLEPEIGVNLFMLALGGLCIWGGLKIWKR